jgi:hypothetical protein
MGDLSTRKVAGNRQPAHPGTPEDPACTHRHHWIISLIHYPQT